MTLKNSAWITVKRFEVATRTWLDKKADVTATYIYLQRLLIAPA